jgi:hypothetical protein
MVERKRGEKERQRGEIETEARKRGKKKIWRREEILARWERKESGESGNKS